MSLTDDLCESTCSDFLSVDDMSNLQNGTYSYLNKKNSDLFTFSPELSESDDEIEYRFHVESFDIDSAFIHFLDANLTWIDIPEPFKLFRIEPGMPGVNEMEVARRNSEFIIRPERSYTLKYNTTPIWGLNNQKQQSFRLISKRVKKIKKVEKAATPKKGYPIPIFTNR